MFGHHSANIAGAHIDTWGSGPLMLREGRRVWMFDFSDMFGPLLLRKDDFTPLDKQPTDERHPFWAPFNRWLRAGKKCRAVRTNRGKLRFYLCHLPPRTED